MDDLSALFQSWWTAERLLGLAKAVFLLVLGLVLGRLAGAALWRLINKRVATQQAVLARRTIHYGIFFIFLGAALHQLGFDLGVLLGAAGILSVAIGFASQTSASNLISGLFLIAEQPFGIGDVIQVGSTVGEVLSIDLLSVKLRTFDNLFVRIPNESLIKSEVRTLTKFPIRRLDLKIGVGYEEDIEAVRAILTEVAHLNPLCLEEPTPTFIFVGFGASSLDFQFSPWATQENFLEMKNTIQLEIYRRFEQEGIEIPFQQVALNRGSGREPIDVRLVGHQDGDDGGPAVPT